MNKAREIVCMLIYRERFAKKLMTLAKTYDNEKYLTIMTSQWAEAHNAAEQARRILYDKR